MIQTFKNTNEIAEAIAQMLFELIKQPSDAPIHIALSGGNTPKQIFAYLTQKYGNKLADKRFHFWWGDDRCVAPDHNDSNYKWANELWLQPMGIASENIHRVMGENLPEAEAKRYAEEMKKWIEYNNNLPAFDLIILGLGEDGHTASIFPHQMELLDIDELCAVASHPVSGQKRISFTGKVLNNAKQVVFISTGSSKKDMIRNVAINALPQYPASHIKPQNGQLTWLIDEDALPEK